MGMMRNVKMRKLRLFFRLILLYITALEIGAVQKFTDVPAYTEADPGDDVLLTCKVSDKKGICSWQKDYKPVGMYRGKYEWNTPRNTMNGDCSLLIRTVKPDIDDGLWQCQVTASSFHMQDALSSPPVSLAVRVAPQPPTIIYNGSHVLPDQKAKVSEGSNGLFTCEVRYANPPAQIEWFIGSGRLIAWNQTNVSESDTPRLWTSSSTLELGVTKATHGRQLVCRARHPSYPAPNYKNAYATLDVTYIPVVSIAGPDANRSCDLEEDLSTLSLNCNADGNPKPHVWWTKDGKHVVSNGSELVIIPVTRNHSGVYGCQAKNIMGQSDPAKIKIDVKYAPRIVSIGPKLNVDADLYSEVTLECKATGNPPPSYHWQHCPTTSGNEIPAKKNGCAKGNIVSCKPRLELFNVSYDQDGKYFCFARNHIGSMVRTHQSEAITLNVSGPPSGKAVTVVNARRGSNTSIKIPICANPPPSFAYWVRGAQRLEVPTQDGRLKALDKEVTGDCYLYTLFIEVAQTFDEGEYTLQVENDKGLSKHVVLLFVNEYDMWKTLTPVLASVYVTAMMICFLMLLVNRRVKTEDEILESTSGARNILLRNTEVATRTTAYRQEHQAYHIEMLTLDKN